MTSFSYAQATEPIDYTLRLNLNNIYEETKLNLPIVIEIKPEPKPKIVIKTPVDTVVPPAQIKALIDKYFPVNARASAYKIARCESGFRSNAVGDTSLQYWQNGIKYGASYGVFQIRYLPRRPEPTQLLNAEFNIKYASNLYKAQGFFPWTCARHLGIV